MPIKVRIVTILMLFVLAVLHLQGCSVSEDVGAPADDSEAIRLALATSTGSTVLVADGVSSVPVQLTVTNTSGQPVPNTPVTFTTDAGTLSAPAEAAAAQDAATRANGDGSSVTVNTGANGVAQATLTSSTTVETATVIAEAMGFSTTIQIDFISGIPAQIALTAIPSTVGVGMTTTLQATVTTADGTPVEGATVTFSIPGNNSGASLSPTSGTTNTNGQIAAIYSAGSAIGTDTVQAEVSGAISATVDITVQLTDSPVSSLSLLVSSPQLDSDGSEMVTLTALARDQNNNFVSGVPVTFVADSGGIQVTSGTTGAAGTATALLSTAGDPTNRTIRVTATAGTLVDTNTVNVTGTTVTLSGVNSLVLNETTTFSILLRDSAGNGIPNKTITVSSTQGNTLSATTVTTDPNGQTTVDVTATVAGPDTIGASALGATGEATLTISSANFFFKVDEDEPPAEVDLGFLQPVTVHWDEAGVNQPNEIINFFATRGTLSGGDVSASSDTTDGNGDATVFITSTNAGRAVITAAATTPGGPASQVTIEFVAITPASLVLQASLTTLSVNAPGSSDQQSIITAIVRDAIGNLVKNQDVSFTLTDVSGGSIFPASARTDSFGRASTVYTAGSAASAQDGVIIDATVAGITTSITLTVAQQSLFVVLGTGNLVQGLSDTQYAKTYSALVTDANGNPIESANVEINLFPTRYQKGFYVRVFDGDGNFVVWAKSLTVNPTNLGDDIDRACNNEDVNRNGLLNPGEDANNNGVLDPGNIATVPINVTTDATGFAFFDIVYAREFTWVEIQIEVRVTVFGSEDTSTATFFLPGLASDFLNEDIAPPGATSAFGIATTCACDESVDPTCPTVTGPVVITPASATLPNGGGTTGIFRVAGGIQTTYTVANNAGGTLTNVDTGVSGGSITVVFGETFTLTTTNVQDDSIITLTAIDDVTGQTGTAIVTQQP